MLLKWLQSDFYRQMRLRVWLLVARLYGYYLIYICLVKIDVPNDVPIFVDPLIRWVIEPGSLIIIKKDKSINLAQPNINSIPNGIFIGGEPEWQYLNPPVGKRTVIRLKTNARLVLGQNVLICKGTYISVWPMKTVELKPNVYIGHECYVNSRLGMVFGESTMVGHKTTIMDYDGHPIYQVNSDSLHVPTDATYGGQANSIIIDDRVWIGFESVILKGAHLHKGTIIGARSVVTSDCTSNSIYAGNPAKLLRSNVTWAKF